MFVLEHEPNSIIPLFLFSWKDVDLQALERVSSFLLHIFSGLVTDTFHKKQNPGGQVPF